jgi:glycosyltransferase involved in cell wall biosynthesis
MFAARAQIGFKASVLEMPATRRASAWGLPRVPAPQAILLSRSVDGGISEYMHAQANELARRGLSVTMLAPRRFIAAHPDRAYRAVPVPAVADTVQSRVLRRALFALFTVVTMHLLAWHVLRRRPAFVLLDSMSELLAPLWALPHLLLARLGKVPYLATLHDPVRERALGPQWWHDLSVRAGYAPLSLALVHDLAAARAAKVPAHVRLVEVPHGIFPAARNAHPRNMREALGIPRDAPVALSFGYVVDRKNLNLAIAALQQVPALHLVVAGRRGSLQDAPPQTYREQAERLGVADRCHFIDRFIPDSELDDLFRMADFVLLTYAASFVSQSGVLHVAANWGKPVLASGGAGPLIDTVARFGLGRVVAPDDAAALGAGLSGMVGQPPDPAANANAWQAFRAESSWSRNIDLLLAALAQAGVRLPLPDQAHIPA